MAQQFSGNIKFSLAGAFTGDNDLSTVAQAINYSKSYNMTNGTGADQAHTITSTGLLRNGGASSPYDLATFSAYIGAGISLIAHGGYWYIHAARNITFS